MIKKSIITLTTAAALITTPAYAGQMRIDCTVLHDLVTAYNDMEVLNGVSRHPTTYITSANGLLEAIPSVLSYSIDDKHIIITPNHYRETGVDDVLIIPQRHACEGYFPWQASTEIGAVSRYNR